MTKKDIFQFVNKLSDMGIPTMIYRETVFDIISFGKSSKIYLSSTSSIEKIKKELHSYNAVDVQNQPESVKFTMEGDTFFVRSIANMSYDDFIKNVVATDLTFNSLLMKPNGQIFDMHNGLPHLRNKQLCFVEGFSEEVNNKLALNCIRYIYRNGFQYDDMVKQYILKSISTFSKSEKTNALFYLIEYISKHNDHDCVTLVLNNNFFNSDKNLEVNISDYSSIMKRTGVSDFIYLLMLLLGVNANKSRFASMVDVEEYNTIKTDFNVDLHKEENYIKMKERNGEDYLHRIIELQREFAYITAREYAEPQFNEKTIFDMIEQSDSFVSTLDDLLLCDEVMSVNEEDTSDKFLSPDDKSMIDFNNCNENDTSKQQELSETINSESCDLHDVFATDSEDDKKPFVANVHDSTDDSAKEESDNAMNYVSNESILTMTTNNTQDDGNIQSEGDVRVTASDEQNVPTQREVHDVPDDISSILNSDDERANFGTGKRSVNPRLGQNATAFTPITRESRNRSGREKRTLNANSFPRTRAEVAAMRSSTDDFNLDEMFSTEGTKPAQPQTMASRTASVIDSIFEEEVKVPEIILAPGFDTLIAQVTEETKDNNSETRGVRNVVTETLMTDVVPEHEEGVSSHETASTQDTPEVFEINEQDLEEILAELNGKKKNSFLDDDSMPVDLEDEIIGNDEPSYNPQASSPQDDDDDFFRTLNDDFTEIVGGNS